MIARATHEARAAVIDMGGTGFATLQAAIDAANPGDTIDIAAGTYTDQVATVNKALTIQGVGGDAVFTQSADTQLANLKGFLEVEANATLSNLVFQGASISDANGANGAGIRYEAGTLAITDSQFIGNQDGILATPFTAGTGSITISNSVFSGNGVASGVGAGYAHAIYATDIATLSVSDSLFTGTILGHDIKSRAASTNVSGNYLDDGVTGSASYAIDLPNGGAGVITGNVIAQGANTQNEAMVSYGEEGLSAEPASLTVTDNSFVNADPTGSIGIVNASPVVADVSGNDFACVATPVSGPADFSANTVAGVAPGCPLPAAVVPASVPAPGGAASWGAGLALLMLARRRRINFAAR
ncbi:MAG: hypothetical protein KGL12_14250 [Rhodospirillales bacterium]|nr:hypothetical protein [Rhodospirillales bacterium]